MDTNVVWGVWCQLCNVPTVSSVVCCTPLRDNTRPLTYIYELNAKGAISQAKDSKTFNHQARLQQPAPFFLYNFIFVGYL